VVVPVSSKQVGLDMRGRNNLKCQMGLSVIGQPQLASRRRLAPLPTTTPESAGLFALDCVGSLRPVTAHQ
jgi:hypothetical protein